MPGALQPQATDWLKIAHGHADRLLGLKI